MQLYSRDLEKQIDKWIFRNKILVVYGARQVGKTTFVKMLLEKYGKTNEYYDCDNFEIKDLLESQNFERMKSYFGNSKMIVLDEAQRVRNIGISLKILHDNLPDLQIIATGSSSFELSNKINEPLTGRSFEYLMLPFSIKEIEQTSNRAGIVSRMNKLLVYGMYPEVYEKSDADAEMIIENIASKYLYKDILEFEYLKKSELLMNLLRLIALQLGSEVSKNELAVKLNTSRITVEKYLSLLEKTFVIYRLKPFSRNIRKEINKKEKIYFYDLGIRNALISRFNKIEFRDDIGALWENFCIMERVKHLNNNGIRKNLYFWRTNQQKEIDLVEEYNSEIEVFEFKWKGGKQKIHKEFVDAYKPLNYNFITINNLFELQKEQ